MYVKHKEELASDLNMLRADLMSMQAGIVHENQIPKPSELRAVVNKLQLMIKLIENRG